MNNILREESSKEQNVDLYVESGQKITYFALNLPGVKRTFHLAKDASLEYVELNLLASSQDLEVFLDGEGAFFNASTLTIGTNGKYNFNQKVNHNAPRTNSNITNFAISFGDSNIVFKTIGKIENKMAHSSCKQLSKGIIISDNSAITSEPILLIDEYDVFASHGASIGKMSDEELFYLMSRGLSKEEALKLIIGGLINPFLERLPAADKDKFSLQVNELIKD